MPQTTREEENFCWVVLEVKYSPAYPRELPEILRLTCDATSLAPVNGTPVKEEEVAAM